MKIKIICILLTFVMVCLGGCSDDSDMDTTKGGKGDTEYSVSSREKERETRTESSKITPSSGSAPRVQSHEVTPPQDEEKKEISNNFGYISTSIDWSNNQFVIYGYFYNNNANYDISQISSFTIFLYDSDGLEMFEKSFKDGGSLGKIVIPSSGSWAFQLGTKNYSFNPNEYNLSNGYTVSIECNYKYSVCNGAGACSLCNPFRNLPAPSYSVPQFTPDLTDPFLLPDIDEPSVTVPKSTVCPVCHGCGSCPTCRGTGRYSNYGFSSECSACNGTGKCWECNGTGRP